MLRNFVILVILILMGSVPLSLHRAQAKDKEEHTIIILDTTYFPQTVAVDSGDTVRFINKSGQAHTVFNADGRWATKSIQDDQELLVQIKEGMTGAFYGRSDRWIRGQLDRQP